MIIRAFARVVLIASLILLVSYLIGLLGVGALNATPNTGNVSEVEVASTVKSLRYEIITKTLRKPQNVKTILVEELNESTKKIVEKVLAKYFNSSSIKSLAVFKSVSKPSLYEIFIVTRDHRYFFVKVDENSTTISELKPILIKELEKKKEETQLKAKTDESLNKVELAKIIKRLKYKVYKLVPEKPKYSTSTTIYAVIAEYIYEGKNVLGQTLWKLAAKSTTFIKDWEKVIDVDDQSYWWIASWAQWAWSVENFYHYAKIGGDGLYSYTWAEADFIYAPFGAVLQRIHAWAWVRVWYDGSVEGGAGP